MNKELRPCPFCGGEAEAYKLPYGRNGAEKGNWYYDIRCKKCTATLTGGNESGTIEWWNTRVNND